MLDKLYKKMLRWSAHEKASYYLAILSFAESSFFPIPPDVMLIPMALSRPPRALYLALLTTLTSVLGGIFGYYIGLVAYNTLALPLIEYLNYQQQYAYIFTWFSSYGLWVVLLSGFAPIPYKVFTIAAGSLQMALIPFILASTIGRGARFFLLGILIKYYGTKDAL